MTRPESQDRPPGPLHRLDAHRGLIMWRLLHPVGVAEIAEASQLLENAAGRGGESISLLVVVSPFRWVPEGTVRAAATALLQEHAANLQAVAVVFEARGFGAATLRAVLAAMTAALRRPFPIKVCGALPDAMTWLADIRNQSTEEISRMIETSIGLAADAADPETGSRPE